MAISFSYGSPIQVAYLGGLKIEKVRVTMTGDGSLTTGTAAVPHGAPSGSEVEHVWIACKTNGGLDTGEVLGMDGFSTDTANDEIDVVINTTAAIDNTETAIFDVYYIASAAEPDAGLTSSVDY